jgi:hypothetical protein
MGGASFGGASGDDGSLEARIDDGAGDDRSAGMGGESGMVWFRRASVWVEYQGMGWIASGFDEAVAALLLVFEAGQTAFVSSRDLGEAGGFEFG